MDLDYHFGEKIIITPRNYQISFKREDALNRHYAMIGIGTVQDNYPLYAEAVNEKGLYVAALKFDAFYPDTSDTEILLAPYELIPWILGKCQSVKEAKKMLQKADIVNIPFNEKTGVSPLHYHIADRECSLTVERSREGMKIYENEVGILTNNPPFDFHIKSLDHQKHLTPHVPDKTAYGLGLGAYSLPGDFSSASRFLKLAFLKKYTVCENDEKSSVQTLFRLMSQISVPKGSTLTADNKYHYTTYTCVINATKKIYYYNTYENLDIKTVVLKEESLDLKELITKEM